MVGDGPSIQELLFNGVWLVGSHVALFDFMVPRLLIYERSLPFPFLLLGGVCKMILLAQSGEGLNISFTPLRLPKHLGTFELLN